MPSKSKKLSQAEIGAFEARRDIGAEILQSIKDIKAGKGKVVVPAAVETKAVFVAVALWSNEKTLHAPMSVRAGIKRS